MFIISPYLFSKEYLSICFYVYLFVNNIFSITSIRYHMEISRISNAINMMKIEI